MRIVDQVTSPGGHRINEDRWGHAGPLAWVIDGATDLGNEPFLPAATDVQWLVDQVGRRLATMKVGSADRDPRHLLNDLSARIGSELESLAFPSDRIHPTCSVGLLLATADHLHLARVGDPTCLALGAETVELSTSFFGRREAQAVHRAKAAGTTASLDQDATRLGIIQRRQQYIEGDLEESVFSGHPAAHLRIQSVSLKSAGFDHVLLCTDGFARAVVDYHLYPDWPTLLQACLAHGLSSVIEEIRTYEGEASAPGTKRASTHFKKSDDATALLVRT